MQAILRASHERMSTMTVSSNQPADTSPVRLTIGNLKGGTGKSTTAVLLALGLARDGQRVLLVDADPGNATTYSWSEMAGEGWPSNITVVRWPSTQLAKRVRDAEGTYHHLVIDTGPTDAAILRQALHLSDIFVMPLAPTVSELARLTSTLEAAAEVGGVRDLELAILLNRTVPNTNSRVGVRQELEGRGLPVLVAEVGRREMIANAMGSVPADLGPYEAVLAELRELLAGGNEPDPDILLASKPARDEEATHE